MSKGLIRLSYILSCVAISLGFLSGCATTPESPDMKSVAVWDLENLSMEASSRPDLGQLLSSEIMQSITDSGNIKVVERQKLVTILEELRLGTSELVDDSARLKVGRMIGAQEMVFGGYMVVGSVMRIDLRRVDVETGRVLKTAKKTADAGDLSGWLNAARAAAAELFQS